MERISVFGLGYVGCISAVCLADAGYDVIGVELNAEKVDMINAGKSPIVEPGLDEVLARVVASGKLRATTSCEDAVKNSDLAFICVGTPGNEFGQLQLNALRHVSREIGQALNGRKRPFTVVVRSTVLPGTTRGTVYATVLSEAGHEFRSLLRVAVNPEFMREGTALKDFANPPFTLTGCDNQETAAQLKAIYSGVNAPFVQTEIKIAETVKYACNAYHALKVCFANEIGDACSGLGVDAQEVMRIFRMDNKLNISEAYLRPGYAFGGSCLPKDIKAFLYAAHHANVSVPLLDSILPSNEAQKRHAIDAVLATGEKRVGVYGLSFKADTDDLRESPMVNLVEALIGKGCNVRILDRNVAIAKLTGANRRYIVEEIPHISMLMCDSEAALIEHAKVLVIGIDTPEARRIVDMARPDQIIIDLSRTVARLNNRSQAAA
jgi:GDP-mannose 6-dehydrogenase